MEKKTISILIILLIIFNISGCTGSALFGALTTNTASASTSIPFPDNYRENIINIACEEGGYMGFVVLAKKDNIAVLKVHTTNDIITDIAGANRYSYICIGQMNNKLSIIVTDDASYGRANEKNCEEILNNFSERLSRRLNQ